MAFSLFCLYIAAIILLADVKSLSGKLVDFDVYQKKLHGVHAHFQNSAKANGYLLTVIFNFILYVLCLILQVQT
jgi:hypothetical protein